MKDGPTGIWTRGLRLAKAALSQTELRAHLIGFLVKMFSVWLTNRYPSYYFLYKEVIQPQVPLRLPCYDFALLKEPRFEPNR